MPGRRAVAFARAWRAQQAAGSAPQAHHLPPPPHHCAGQAEAGDQERPVRRLGHAWRGRCAVGAQQEGLAAAEGADHSGVVDHPALLEEIAAKVGHLRCQQRRHPVARRDDGVAKAAAIAVLVVAFADDVEKVVEPTAIIELIARQLAQLVGGIAVIEIVDCRKGAEERRVDHRRLEGILPGVVARQIAGGKGRVHRVARHSAFGIVQDEGRARQLRAQRRFRRPDADDGAIVGDAVETGADDPRRQGIGANAGAGIIKERLAVEFADNLAGVVDVVAAAARPDREAEAVADRIIDKGLGHAVAGDHEIRGADHLAGGVDGIGGAGNAVGRRQGAAHPGGGPDQRGRLQIGDIAETDDDAGLVDPGRDDGVERRPRRHRQLGERIARQRRGPHPGQHRQHRKTPKRHDVAPPRTVTDGRRDRRGGGRPGIVQMH